MKKFLKSCVRDPSFYSKCEEYDLQFTNDIASSSRSQ